jgi:hypothetical protein
VEDIVGDGVEIVPVFAVGLMDGLFFSLPIQLNDRLVGEIPAVLLVF